MPIGLSWGNSRYTPLNTAGTTTLNPGQAGPIPSSFGALYGFSVVAAGTGFGVTLLDCIPGTPAQIGAGTNTVTNTLMNGTGTAGQSFPAGIQGEGVRYQGALIAVTTGTPGVVNVLWD